MATSRELTLRPVEDNDLLEIAIERKAGVNSKYRLAIPAAVRVWRKTADGFERVTNNTDLEFENAADTLLKLYVQGVARTPNDAGAVLRLSSFDATTNGYVPGDKITLHVFDIAGPRNVPDFAKYEYVARSGAGQGNSKFVAPAHGTEKSNTPGGATDKTEVFWTDGAQFGKVRYQASPNYTWAFDVAIVKVDLDFAADASFLKTETNPDNKPVQNTAARRRIDSTTGRSRDDEDNVEYKKALPPNKSYLDEPAMKMQVKIKEMKGPTRSVDGVDKMFGVSKIRVGIVQSLAFTRYSANVGTNNPLPIPDQVRDANGQIVQLEGQTMLDLITKRVNGEATYATLGQQGNLVRLADKEFVLPFYDPAGVTGQGVYGAFQPGSDSVVQDKVLRIADTPFGNGVNDTAVQVPGLGVRTVRGYNMSFTFKDYFVVQTLDDGGTQARQVFTQRAYADWHFDGSGTFGQDGSYTFGGQSGVIRDHALIEKQDGSRLPDGLPSAKIANDHIP